MKLKKHLILILAPLALFAALFLPTQALAQSGTYVFDEQEILSSTEFSKLEDKGKTYASTYKVGVYFLFTDSMGTNESSKSGRNEFARNYYEKHNLGVGSNKDGIIFVVAVKSRKYVTVKHFTNSSTDPFSNDSVDLIESNVKDEIKDNKWYKGACAYYDTVGEHLQYFSEHGKQWEEASLLAPLIKLGVTLLVPLAVAIGVVTTNKSAMLTARLQTEASSYLDAGSFSLSRQSDVFVNRTITSTPRPKDNDSDGGGWSDMGDGFSGSGGGDF